MSLAIRLGPSVICVVLVSSCQRSVLNFDLLLPTATMAWIEVLKLLSIQQGCSRSVYVRAHTHTHTVNHLKPRSTS